MFGGKSEISVSTGLLAERSEFRVNMLVFG